MGLFILSIIILPATAAVTVITGCSSGIGENLALALAALCVTVAPTGRRTEFLEHPRKKMLELYTTSNNGKATNLSLFSKAQYTLHLAGLLPKAAYSLILQKCVLGYERSLSCLESRSCCSGICLGLFLMHLFGSVIVGVHGWWFVWGLLVAWYKPINPTGAPLKTLPLNIIRQFYNCTQSELALASLVERR